MVQQQGVQPMMMQQQGMQQPMMMQQQVMQPMMMSQQGAQPMMMSQQGAQPMMAPGQPIMIPQQAAVGATIMPPPESEEMNVVVPQKNPPQWCMVCSGVFFFLLASILLPLGLQSSNEASSMNPEEDFRVAECAVYEINYSQRTVTESRCTERRRNCQGGDNKCCKRYEEISICVETFSYDFKETLETQTSDPPPNNPPYVLYQTEEVEYRTDNTCLGEREGAYQVEDVERCWWPTNGVDELPSGYTCPNSACFKFDQNPKVDRDQNASAGFGLIVTGIAFFVVTSVFCYIGLVVRPSTCRS